MKKETEKMKDDVFFDEIQSIWDSHSRRVENITRLSGGDHHPFNYSYANRKRRRETWCYVLLTFCLVIAAVRWACIMWRYATDTTMLVLSLLVEASFVLMAALCLAFIFGQGRTPIRRLRAELSQLSVSQATYLIMAVVLILPVMSYGHTGDGLTIKQSHTTVLNHTQRVEAVHTITNMLKQ